MTKRKTNLPFAADRLKSFVDRVDRLETERKAIGADISDVLTEAKSVGYDAGTIRWLVKERGMDSAKRAERDALRETYASALKMAVYLVQEEGLSLREAGQRTGASKSSIHRALAVPAVSHDPATGEVHESSGGVDGHASGEIPAGNGEVERATPPLNPSAAGVEPGPLDTHSPRAGEAEQQSSGSSVAASPFLDMPPIPDFLRRVTS